MTLQQRKILDFLGRNRAQSQQRHLVFSPVLPVSDVRGHDPLGLLAQRGEAFQLQTHHNEDI